MASTEPRTTRPKVASLAHTAIGHVVNFVAKAKGREQALVVVAFVELVFVVKKRVAWSGHETSLNSTTSLLNSATKFAFGL